MVRRNGTASIPDDWLGEYCKYSVCWPNSPQWLAVLRGIITIAASGRFWNEQTGTITEAQHVIEQTFDYNFKHNEVIMACESGTEIAASLALIANALRSQGTTSGSSSNRCCDTGSAGQGATAPPYNPTEQGNPITDDPPPGFEEWGEYNANKCAIATDIVSTLIGDVARMSFINMVGKTVIGLVPILVATFLTPVPGDEILVITAYLLAVVSFGGAFLDAVAEVLSDCEQDLICALYSGSNSASAETLLETAFNDCWDSSAYAANLYSYSAKGLIASMIGSASTNRLFDLETDRTLPAGDCSACECTLFNLLPSSGPWISNLIVGETADSVTTSAGDYTDRNRYDAIVLFHATNFSVCCGDDIELVSITIDSGSVAGGPDATGYGYHLYDCVGTLLYSSTSMPSSGTRCQCISIISANAFTATITIAP